MRWFISICMILICAAPAVAHEYLVGDLAIVHPHARPTAPGATVAGGYMELFNGAQSPERLLAVRSGLADISFFDPNADDGSGARLADAIELPPGQSVFLEPDHLHIRFAGLEEQLQIGDKFLATLVFENAGPVTVEFWVEGSGEVAPLVPASAAPIAGAPEDAEAEIADRLIGLLGPDAQIATVSSSGSAAVAGWMTPEEAGRAFLRHDGDDWQLELLSGDSLTTNAALRAQGLSPRVAADLLAEIQAEEAALPPSTLERLDSFQGTLLISRP